MIVVLIVVENDDNDGGFSYDGGKLILRGWKSIIVQ